MTNNSFPDTSGAGDAGTATRRPRRQPGPPEPVSDASPEMIALGVVGTSAAMRAVFCLIRQAAADGRGVLLCGEAGTGRTRIARAIHALGGGAADSFLQRDCDAVGENLEAELFGNGGPPRTGARTAGLEPLRDGSLLWRARDGTIYLANLVEASAAVQRRLARLMRDREAIGADGSPVRLDCRLIASVEPGFEAALDDGRLRRELRTRLALSIDVPPLRERREDIPALAGFFLEQHAQMVGAPPKQLAPAALQLLQALPWRGNAWELRGLVETLAQSVAADTIDLGDVLASVRLDPRARSVAVGGSLRAARRQFEREYIGAVLQQNGGRVATAARILRIQRTNLYRKIRSLRIRVPASRGHDGRPGRRRS